MPKFKLRLEDLQIDSFTTTQVRREKGTVYGEQCTCHTACTCPGCPTCYASCNGTCDGSCHGTCDAACESADYSCGGTCDGGYSCAPTCEGWQTFPGPNMECVMC
jgi:hypothetical protein